jgi:hypothetical protein
VGTARYRKRSLLRDRAAASEVLIATTITQVIGPGRDPRQRRHAPEPGTFSLRTGGGSIDIGGDGGAGSQSLRRSGGRCSSASRRDGGHMRTQLIDYAIVDSFVALVAATVVKVL